MSDTLTLKLGFALSAATLAAFGFLVASIHPLRAQEFDCRNASYSSERTICGSDHLSALDERMSGAYSDLMQATSNRRARENLRNYQRNFLDARDSCGRDRECIKGAYLDQIDVLESRLEKANRRSER